MNVGCSWRDTGGGKGLLQWDDPLDFTGFESRPNVGSLDEWPLCVGPGPISVHSSSGTHSNGPIEHILDDRTSTLVNFDTGAPGPWWVVFRMEPPATVSVITLKPAHQPESPKQFTVLHSASPTGPWTRDATHETDSAWITARSFFVGSTSVSRYWKLEVATTHNGDPPTLDFVKLAHAGESPCWVNVRVKLLRPSLLG